MRLSIRPLALEGDAAALMYERLEERLEASDLIFGELEAVAHVHDGLDPLRAAEATSVLAFVLCGDIDSA